MKSAASKKGKRVAHDANKRSPAAAYLSVAALAEISANSLEALLQKINDEVFGELEVIARHIATLRQAIAALEPGEMHRKSIPAAGQELDAVVHATESASNRILECAEEVMAASAGDLDRCKAFVQERMLTVFEACSFQDLTGQRIAKVIETLKQIETRVARFAAADRADERAGSSTRGRTAKPAANSQVAVDKNLAASARSNAAARQRRYQLNRQISALGEAPASAKTRVHAAASSALPVVRSRSAA